MSIGQPKVTLPPPPTPIAPPPIAGEDTVRGAGVPKKPNKKKKNPLLLGDAPTANPAAGSSPSGVFGGTPGGLAIP